MCYAKPGPRCSYHVIQQIEKAKSSQDYQKMAQLIEEYKLTPAGIKELRKTDPEQAKEYATLRKNQIKEYKRVHDYIPLKIYRHGQLSPAAYQGEIKEYAERADAVRPAGRLGREGSLYASPSIQGVTRWTRGNLMMSSLRFPDPETYELTINPNTAYVYSIEKWEDYSWRGADPKDYWDSGVLLKDYLDHPEQYDDKEWEVLFTEEDILDVTRLSKQKLVNSIEDEYDKNELERILKENRIK